MLRPYQSEILDSVRVAMRSGIKKVLIESPTGSGKTVLTAKMLHGVKESGRSAWFNVHRVELIEQTTKTFSKLGIPHGIIAAGYPETSGAIQICSVPTLARRDIKPPDLIAWDECHHISAATWTKIYNTCADSYHIGMTATPVWGNNKGLGKWFDTMVRGKSVPWLIENGYLSDFRYFAPSTPDLSAIKIIRGDYEQSALDLVMQGKLIVGEVVKNWMTNANGMMTIGFAPSISASRTYVEAFREAGISAEHLDGNTPKSERARIIKEFAHGKIKILFNVGLFGEGFDISAIAEVDVSIQAVILARPTMSLGLSKQQIGRALRQKPDPAIILDHAGNWTRHGMPDDVIEWSLEGSPKRDLTKPIAITQCPECYMVFRARAQCPYCGVQREISQRSLHYMAGELKEIDRQKQAQAKELAKEAARQARAEVGRARTQTELVAIGIQRGYRYPSQWAEQILEGRKRKK